MSDRLVQAVRAMRTAAGVGNVVKAFEWGLAAISGEGDPFSRSRLIGEVDHIVAQWNGRLTASEHRELSRLAGTLAGTAADLPEAVRAFAEGAPPSLKSPCGPSLRPGVVPGLFVVNGYPLCGAVNEIQATVLPGEQAKSRNIHFINPSGELAVSYAVHAAGLAVQQMLTDRGLTARGRGALLAEDIFVQIGEVEQVYEGTSLGLGVALAVLSALLDQPVPTGVACTGTVLASGELRRVEGIVAKLDAAAYKDMQAVYIPEANFPEVPHARKYLAKPVKHLGEVVEQVFGDDRLRGLIDRLNSSSSKAALAREGEEHRLSGKTPVLLSVVGNRDPYGDPQFRTKAMNQGSLLAAFSYVRPQAVCLLDNRLLKDKEAGERSERELKAMAPSTLVRRVVLDLTDPTDYDQLYETMHGSVLAFLQAAAQELRRGLEDLAVYVNLSSGTAQMHAIWLEFIRSGLFRTCCPLQVREPDHLVPGEGRVREVTSRHLGIGQITTSPRTAGRGPRP